MRSIVAFASGILVLVTGAGCSTQDDDSPRSAKEIVLERFPECSSYVSDANPTVKGNVISFGCGVEVDGPAYFLDARTGELICTCGMLCDPGCPPAEFRFR